jgi:pimeloyl-ACP methyl ester carboxylesterase
LGIALGRGGGDTHSLVRVRQGVLLAVIGGLMSLPASEATALTACRSGDESCATVTVPLDRSGAVPGTVRLRIQLERAEPATDPPLLAIGGEPGQATTSRLDAGAIASTLSSSFHEDGRTGYSGPSRDVILMDLRGTGRSSPLRCKDLERSVAAGISEAAAACAAALGARRGFYTARDSAEDIEAVRQALGVERIALYGVSYGARVALTYAQRYPSRVDRLMLQSPPPPEGYDLLYRPAFAAIPAVVEARCGPRACRHVSPSPVTDVVALARRLEDRPMRGQVVDGSGRRRMARLVPFDLIQALAGAGAFSVMDPAEAPGLILNALRGDAAPLLRARRIARWYEPPSSFEMSRYFSQAAYAASVCEESVFPWPRSAPLEDRYGHASNLAFGQPPSAFHPLGPRAALGSDLLELCLKWPVASGPPNPLHALPGIPTLILAAEQDLQAPVTYAEAVSVLIPGTRVLKVPGDGSELNLQLGSCIGPAFREFFADRTVPTRCGRPQFARSRARPAPPLSLAEVATAPGSGTRAERTLEAVRLTLRDGAKMVVGKFFARLIVGPPQGRRARLRLYGAPVRTGALRRGTYRLGFRKAKFALRDASYVPGVRISGAIRPVDSARPVRVRGRLRVLGRTAAHGTLTLRGLVLSGELAGRPVRTFVGEGIYPDISYGR